MAARPQLTTLAAAVALCLLALGTGTDGAGLYPRHLLQVPTNCTAPDDSWTREAFTCTVPPAYTVQCAVASLPAPAGTVQCQVVDNAKPNIRSGMTCPVQECKAVCDLVVMQNFFPPDLVFATTELLAAWKPATPGC